MWNSYVGRTSMNRVKRQTVFERLTVSGESLRKQRIVRMRVRDEKIAKYLVF
jgi:hypothetical protein